MAGSLSNYNTFGASRTYSDASDETLVESKNAYASKDNFDVETSSLLPSLSSNPFQDRNVAEHYRHLYEQADYECRHEFNPLLQWTVEEERKIVRKIDWHVALWACIMFFALNVDRKNLGQAVSDNLLDDLGLTTDDYNHGNMIFFCSFLLAELPSQLISKKVGPDRWIPAQMVLWSIVAASQAALSGRTSFFLCRSLLGMLEGGFIPDLVLWLSYFYKSGELSLRLSFFWVTLNLTVVACSFLAYALLHLRGVAGLEGWRWLFLIEGLITMTIGFASFFMMPASAVETKTWFRPNGWFTDRETAIVVNRVLRDDPTKGDMNNREGISMRGLWNALCDYDLWPLYLIGLFAYVPQDPPSTYLTLSLKSLGFSTFDTNLLSVPCELASCVTLLGITWISERLGERSLVSALQNVWVLPCLIALRWWPHQNSWGTYGLITVLLSYPSCHAIIASWVSRNSASVRTRTVSAALYNMAVQAGRIYSATIYTEADKPIYRKGNSTLIALDVLAIGLFLFAKVYYVRRNAASKRKWDAMTIKEQEDYLATTTDEGNKRLDFRFTH